MSHARSLSGARTEWHAAQPRDAFATTCVPFLANDCAVLARALLLLGFPMSEALRLARGE